MDVAVGGNFLCSCSTCVLLRMWWSNCWSVYGVVLLTHNCLFALAEFFARPAEVIVIRPCILLRGWLLVNSSLFQGSPCYACVLPSCCNLELCHSHAVPYFKFYPSTLTQDVGPTMCCPKLVTDDRRSRDSLIPDESRESCRHTYWSNTSAWTLVERCWLQVYNDPYLHEINPLVVVLFGPLW